MRIIITKDDANKLEFIGRLESILIIIIIGQGDP